MDSKRTPIILVVVAIVAFAITNSTTDDTDGNDVSADQNEPTATAPSVEESTPAEVATAFWEAVVIGDRERALGFVDPTAIDKQGPSPFGRAHTLEGQFDWYEVVGWEWQFNGCVESTDITADCTATARNTWSDALGVEPITGMFVVRFGDQGIIDVGDKFSSFIDQWSVQVFGVFRDWVSESHPEDAAIMFEFDVDINPEILRLYELNTNRFVDAQPGQ